MGERDFDLNEYCAGRWPLCLVTVAGGPKARLYTSTLDLASLLEMGPALLDTIAGWQVARRLPTVPKDGLHLDPEQRLGAVWSWGEGYDAVEACAGYWPGWRWENWKDRLPTEDPVDEALSAGLRGAFIELSEDFEKHQVMDAGTEGAALLLKFAGHFESLMRTTGAKVSTVEDNSFTHHPIELTPAELADTREAIATAALRA